MLRLRSTVAGAAIALLAAGCPGAEFNSEATRDASSNPPLNEGGNAQDALNAQDAPIDSGTTLDMSLSDGFNRDAAAESIDTSAPDARDTVIAYTASGASKGVNAANGIHNEGRQFQVTAAGISIVDLGIWDFNADGLAAPHVVTLFALDRIGAGAVATPVAGASVVVPAGTVAPLDSGFRFASLPAPIDVAPGMYAVVAYGMNDSDPYGDGGNVPLSTTGVRDSRFDVFEVTSDRSPSFPKGGDSNNHSSASFHFRSSQGKILKIMPLGASITEGFGSSGGGYRSPLAALLASRQVPFQFVGSLTTNPGTLSPDELHHEGHSGAVITAGDAGRPGISDSIRSYLGPTGVTPDIILLLLGTNDVDVDFAVAGAPGRMDALLTTILDKKNGLAPNARVILAQLPPINDPIEDQRVIAFNAGLVSVTAKHKSAGEKISMVDMHPVIGPNDFFDKLHPNDAGYAKLATVWLDAILAP